VQRLYYETNHVKEYKTLFQRESSSFEYFIPYSFSETKIIPPIIERRIYIYIHNIYIYIKMRNQFLRVDLLPRAQCIFSIVDETARESPLSPSGSLLTCNGKKARQRCIVKLAHRKQSSHSSRSETEREGEKQKQEEQ